MSEPDFKPDFSRHFQRGNKDATIRLNDFASVFGLRAAIQKLFEKDHVTCFRFIAKIGERYFADGRALFPETHNEQDVAELADEMWARFTKSMRRVIMERSAQ